MWFETSKGRKALNLETEKAHVWLINACGTILNNGTQRTLPKLALLGSSLSITPGSH